MELLYPASSVPHFAADGQERLSCPGGGMSLMQHCSVCFLGLQSFTWAKHSWNNKQQSTMEKGGKDKNGKGMKKNEKIVERRTEEKRGGMKQNEIEI
eukprot:1152402-Pelagomonas_calceolata.AAC.9